RRQRFDALYVSANLDGVCDLLAQTHCAAVLLVNATTERLLLPLLAAGADDFLNLPAQPEQLELLEDRGAARNELRAWVRAAARALLLSSSEQSLQLQLFSAD